MRTVPQSPPFAIGEPVAYTRHDGQRIVALEVIRCAVVNDQWQVWASDAGSFRTFRGAPDEFESMIHQSILDRVADGVLADLRGGGR